MHCGGIILCGGRSTRMGRDKATLPFGDELLLPRMVRLLSAAVQPIVVVAAPQQEIPPLPPHIMLAHDQRDGRGPLEGLRAGLQAIEAHADAAFVTSCDAPLLSPALVRRVIELLDDGPGFDMAVPRDGQLHHPLAAVYRTRVLPQVKALLSADCLRLLDLLDVCPTLSVQIEELRSIDPQLLSLLNCNRPEDYLAALVQAGLMQA